MKKLSTVLKNATKNSSIIKKYSKKKRFRSLGVAQDRHPPQRPVLGHLRGPQEQVEYVGQVRPPRLLVHGAVVQLVVPGQLAWAGVDRVDVDDGHGAEEDLGLRLDQLAVAPVPTRPVYVQPVHVHATWRLDYFKRSRQN